MENTIKNVTLGNIENGFDYLKKEFHYNSIDYWKLRLFAEVDGSTAVFSDMRIARNRYLQTKHALQAFGVDTLEMLRQNTEVIYYRDLLDAVKCEDYKNDPATLEKIATACEAIKKEYE